MTSELSKNNTNNGLYSRSNFPQIYYRPLIISLMILATSPSYANKSDEMLCSLNGSERAVYIQHESALSAVPCDVVENKRINSPDSATSLWSAGEDPGYCKKMLIGYVEKLRGLGFDCWHNGSTATIHDSVIFNPPK